MAEESDEPKRRHSVWDVPVYALTVLVYAAFLFVLWPLLIYVWIRHARDERRTRRQLAAEARLLDWDRARERVLAGKGILVVEMMPPSGYGHVWWIDDQRLAEHPSCPLPELREPRSRTLLESLITGPPADWCREHLTVLLKTSSRIDGRMPKDFDEGLPPQRVRVVWESWADGPQSAITPKPMPPLTDDL
jgi:hypothetical protein